MFTVSELRDLQRRWQIVELLHDNVPQREIARRLGVSLCKITRGGKLVKDEHSVTRAILEQGDTHDGKSFSG